MSNDVSTPMGQKSFTNYRALVLSYELREAMLGIINPGVYSGFDTLHVYDGRLGLSHEKSGIIKTVYLPSEQGGGVGKSRPTGVFITKFGTIIHDDEEVSFAVPPDDGYYLVYAKYLRPTAGDEFTVMVPVTYLTLRMTDIKGTTDIDKLGETDTPITIFRKVGDTYTLLSHEKQINSVPNQLDMGNMTQLELLTSMGTLGLGRFKYLGRTIQSISKFVSDQIDWNRIQLVWNNTLLTRVGWPNYPNGSEEADDNYGVKFISSIWTIWNDLVALDKECQNLWNKLGYPGEQPSNEEVLLIANTVWQNLVALENYSDKLSDDIWQRLGLVKGEPSEIHSILDKADTVWNNLLALLDKLDTLDNHVRTDTFEDGGIQSNLDHIWATLGYDKTTDVEQYKYIIKSNSVWDNLKAITDYIESDVEKNNDFVITSITAGSKEAATVVSVATSSHNKKTFLWEISEDKRLSSGGIKEFRVNLSRPWTDDKFDQRVSLLIWRPSVAGCRLYVEGGITQATKSEKTEFYLANGGMALLYKLNKTQSKWYIQILNPGSGGGGGGDVDYTAQGLIPGYEKVTTMGSWTGQTTGIPDNQGCVRVSTGVGVSEIDYNSFIYEFSSGVEGASWGSRSTYYIAIARPTEDQLGAEKIIMLGGSVEDKYPNNRDVRYLNYPGAEAMVKLDYSDKMKKAVCLNFSLPLQTIIPTGLPYSINSWGSISGVITNWSDGSYLKWPGDWVRLRAETDPDDGTYKWRIISNGYGLNNSILLYQIRMGNSYERGNSYRDVRKIGGNLFYADSEKWRILWPGGGNREYKPVNGTVMIKGRNVLEIAVPLYPNDGNPIYKLWLDKAVPFPDANFLGQTHPVGGDTGECPVTMDWLIDPADADYGEVYFSNSVGAKQDRYFIVGPVTWNFVLGGPVAAMANYVMHNVDFED